jgi:hypothetical protein
MRTYRPRCAAELEVPVFGKTSEIDEQAAGLNTVKLDVRIRSFRLELNDHNHADVLRIEGESKDIGVDPRFLKNATIRFWLDDIGTNPSLTKTAANLLFAGVCVTVHRTAHEGTGFSVDMEFHDYTAFYIAQKPYVVEGAPLLSMSIRDAWQMICDNTGFFDRSNKSIRSNVSQLKDAIQLKVKSQSTITLDTPIGKGIPKRFTALGARVPVGKSDTAWDVWNKTVGPLGLITYFSGVDLVVADTTEYYAIDEAPIMVWGSNIAEADDNANCGMVQKGVGLVGFNPTLGVLESFWPPPGDPLFKVKRTRARAAGDNTMDLQSDQYEMYEYNYIQNQEELDALAQRAFEERARQEYEGTIKTYEMSVETASGDQFNLLHLRAGAAIRIELDRFDKSALAGMTFTDRVDYLLDIGYSGQMAVLIASNADAFTELRNVFHVKRNCIAMNESSFTVDITYCNYIDVRGHATEPTPVTVVNEITLNIDALPVDLADVLVGLPSSGAGPDTISGASPNLNGPDDPVPQ